MKIRLFYKIYFVVLFSVSLSVAISVLVVGYYGYRNFREYLAQSKLQEFNWLAEKLGDYYISHKGFDDIMGMRLLMKHDDDPNSNRFAPRHGMDGFPPDGRHFPFGDLGIGKIDKEHGREPRNDFMKNVLYNEKTGLNINALIRYEEFVSLFDKDHNVITGKVEDISNFLFTPIKANGAVVGYLGIRKPPQVEHPLAIEFIRQQKDLMLISAVLIIIFTGVASWMFTKKVLSPVGGLITATKKLALRDFDIVIDKEANDELGDLAVNFQHMADDLRMYEVKQNRWISDISHELRTPLSVILGSIEAMQDGVRKPDSQTMETLHKEVKRLIKLVNDLHEVTMAESGSINVNFQPVRIGDAILAVLSLFKARAAEFGFELEYANRFGSKTISGDVSRLNQVFINLLENSIKHAKSPGVIHVTGEMAEGHAIIYFDDSGPGVNDSDLPMLFDRLFRSDRSRNSETGGSGLGLAICKSIIEKHGGTIQAQRSPLGGLRVEIIIPSENNNE